MKLISKKVVPGIRSIVSVVSLAAILLVSAQVSAATPSQCKGLENSACTSNSACSWVQGYERKDGRKVSAFCRTSTKSKPTSSTAEKTGNKAS